MLKKQQLAHLSSAGIQKPRMEIPSFNIRETESNCDGANGCVMRAFNMVSSRDMQVE